MRETYLALCDYEKEYVDHLTDYFLRKPFFPFKIGSFYDEKTLLEYLEQNSIDLLFISEEMWNNCQKMIHVKHIVLINDGMNENNEEYPSIYKYQSAEKILKELMEYLVVEEYVPKSKKGNQKTVLSTFYTPVRRCLQTTTAFQFAEKKAQKEQVLFVSIEPYSNLEQIVGTCFEEDLSDLIYLSQGDSDKFSYKLSAMITKNENLHILPIVQQLEDLQYISKERWVTFFTIIKKLNLYDRVVVDLGFEIQGFENVLEFSDEIIQIVLQDQSTNITFEKYEKMLQKKGILKIQEKTNRVSMPQIFATKYKMEEFKDWLDSTLIHPEAYSKEKTVSFLKRMCEENL